MTDAPQTTEFIHTRIALFIYDATLRRNLNIILRHLGYDAISDYEPPANYFEAVRRCIPIVSGEAELVLINFPSKIRPKTRSGQELPVFDEVNSLYLDLKTQLAQKSMEPLKFLSKTIPVIEVGDYLREKLVEVLFRYRVPAAFFMSAVPPTAHLQGDRKKKQERENIGIHLKELSQYLNQYFRDKNELVALADAKLNEKELTERKKTYDELMDQAEKVKAAGDLESAINILKKAITVYPKDIEAYLESGRLYVRRKEYGRALSRFGQAEELFEDAPTPNREIAGMRMEQVREKIEAGADPRSPEILELLNDAVQNFQNAQAKIDAMAQSRAAEPGFKEPAPISQDILRWNLTDMLGPSHPAVQTMLGLVEASTSKLGSLPMEQLSGRQCIAMGLVALEKRDIPKAMDYCFKALDDTGRFAETCSDINQLGMKLRGLGLVDKAIEVYERLLVFQPHNQGSVYWNLSIAFALKKDVMSSAGNAARCLYTDPYIAREDDFYGSLNLQQTAVIVKLIQALRQVVRQIQSVQTPPQMVKLYQIRSRLLQHIVERKNREALDLLMKLLQQAASFTTRPEFYADGVVPRFLIMIQKVMTPRNGAKPPAALKAISQYLKYVADHPAPAHLVRFMKLCRRALDVVETGDQRAAAYFMGQAIVAVPPSYFARPDFFAQETLPALVRELAGKFKYVDTKRFPGIPNKTQ